MNLRLRNLTVALGTATLLFAGCARSADGAGSGDVASLSEDQGDEESSTAADAESTEEELLDWAQCMRDEGVNIPDPEVDADGRVQIGGPPPDDGEEGEGDDGNGEEEGGDGRGRERMEAATEECGDPPIPGPGSMSEEDRQGMQDAALEFAECMRDQGVDFPDPDFSEEGPGGAPGGPEAEPDESEEGDGDGSLTMRGPFGEIDMDDPEMREAFEACQGTLGEFGPPGEGPGRGGSGEPDGGEGSA